MNQQGKIPGTGKPYERCALGAGYLHPSQAGNGEQVVGTTRGGKGQQPQHSGCFCKQRAISSPAPGSAAGPHSP
eukprot:483193-Pelagomonas_calceolata.AAC.10